MDTEKYRELYLAEARKHLVALERAAVDFRSTPVDAESLKDATRAAHTLRGMSATMGYGQLAHLAGEVEALLGGLEQDISAGNCEIAGILAECLGVLRELVGHVEDGETQDVDVAFLVLRMKALV